MAFVLVAVVDCFQPSKASTVEYLVEMWNQAVVEVVALHQVVEAY